jgi:hypothetical protein
MCGLLEGYEANERSLNEYSLKSKGIRYRQ